MSDIERIERLEAVISEHQKLLAEARAEIAELKQSTTPTASVSRREWLRRAALAGGALVAADAVTAGPAAATNNDPLLVGNQTDAESTTILFADGTGPNPYPHGVFHVTDTAFLSQAGIPVAAVTGYAGTSTSGTVGVAGLGSTNGIYGQSTS